MKRLAWILIAAFTTLACGPKASVRIPERPGRVDAPYELQSDEDLADTRMLFDSLPPAAPGRAKMRQKLATEYARRIDKRIEKDEAALGFERFQDLLTLWSPSELANPGPEFSRYAPQAQAIRKRFSQSGGTEEAVASLTALAMMSPQRAQPYLEEIDEILAYSNELAVAQNGPSASRAYPIRILESVAEFLPTDYVIDKLLALYIERQGVISSAIRRGNANIDVALLRLHGEGLLTTTRNIVRLLAQSDRVDAIMPSIAKITGLGDDAELRKRVQAAIASSDSGSWIALSAMFVARPKDLKASLAFCSEAIRRYPGEPQAYLTAGSVAEKMGNTPLAIRYYELGLKIDGDFTVASQSLASLYEQRVNELSHGDRPNAALKQLQVFERFHAKASKLLGEPLEPDLASAYAVMARGLVSLGDLKAARDYLSRSLKLRPNLPSLEYLGLIALRQGHFAEARTHFAAALEIPGEGFVAQFDANRLQRLAGEALLGLGKSAAARKEFKATRAAWLALLNSYEVPPSPEAGALIELGKLDFHLGNRDDAIEHFFQASRVAPDNSSNHADLVAFLVNQGALEEARDVFLDALGNDHISEYYKIYMSLWVLAEARHQKQEVDPHALQFLQERESTQWSATLARYCVGMGDRKKLEAMATTRGRRAELLYYSAVLGPESKNAEQTRLLLEEVLRGDMVLFFEYEMATRRLADR
jgi:tetratricopeptide (TPR) repeat protein